MDVTIEPSCSFELRIPVVNVDSTLSYSNALLFVCLLSVIDLFGLEFSTYLGDIMFEVLYEVAEGGTEPSVVIPHERIASDTNDINGAFRFQKPGVCVFIFDNGFSWLTPKSLSYEVDLTQVSGLFPLLFGNLYHVVYFVVLALIRNYGESKMQKKQRITG